jgi:hypothetical protein
MAFLTLEDPNAKIEGSRDPLGGQPIWARFARHVVTNLTSQSTSVRGFTILLFGRYFSRRLVDEGLVGSEQALDVFLRMEQLGAYARFIGHGVEGGIRGIERVRERASQNTVVIQSNREGMILSDQRVYGLWGLYSVPARVSGLIPDGPVGVEPEAQKLVEEVYMQHFDVALKLLTKVLAQGDRRFDVKGRNPILDGLKKVLPEQFSSREAGFYADYLRDGAHVRNDHPKRQALFARLLREETDLNVPLSRGELNHLVKAAGRQDEELACRLQRIGSLEAVLAPASVIFDHILTKKGASPEKVAKGLKDQWGRLSNVPSEAAFQDLVAEIAESSSPEISTSISRFHRSLLSADYTEGVHALLELNLKVMEARRAAPWVRMTNGSIDVRYGGAETLLPDREEMADLWLNSYFIDALKVVTAQVEGRR